MSDRPDYWPKITTRMRIIRDIPRSCSCEWIYSPRAIRWIRTRHDPRCAWHRYAPGWLRPPSTGELSAEALSAALQSIEGDQDAYVSTDGRLHYAREHPGQRR